MLVDTHTHLNFGAFADSWRDVADRAVAAGVENMIVVGTDVETSRRAVELAHEHAALFAAVGIHPHHAKQYSHPTDFTNDLVEIEELANNPRVVAVGEIGLDKHEYKSMRYTEAVGDWDMQVALLRNQVSLAKKLDKPVILHSRDLHDEVLDVVREAEVRGVFHCFEGSKKYAKRILEAGFYISFTGNITFIDDRADVTLEVPLHRLLLETDSPYMTPAPFRGKVNEPVNVRVVAEKHATMRAIQLDEVASRTTENAKDLFGL